MTIINQKSISGITSITFASAGDDLLTFHSNNGTERFRIDNSGNTKITAGIVTTLTVTGNGTVGGTLNVTSVDVDGGHINLESGYSLQWGDSHERIEQSDSKLEFFTNNSEQMTLSGSNLGLGTNSNLSGLLTLHQNDDQLFLKQRDRDWETTPT